MRENQWNRMGQAENLQRNTVKIVGPQPTHRQLSAQNAEFRSGPIKNISGHGSMQVTSPGLWRFSLHGFLACSEFIAWGKFTDKEDKPLLIWAID